MELKLDAKEVEKILLEWAEKSWPKAFNEVHVEAQYGSFQFAEFSKTSEKKEAV